MSRTYRTTKLGKRLNDSQANEKWSCRRECLYCESGRLFKSNKSRKIAYQQLKEEQVK